MTRSKSKKDKAAALAEEAQSQSQSQSSSTTSPAPSPTTQQPSSSALIICRNKHWRYISSFHGPWLQLPPEVLESLAYSNYTAPRPRPIDPAVFFDLLKIRKHIDEATTLAVRAASGVASSLPQKDHHLLLGISNNGPSPRLSRERKHRMRELATQKLSKAYKLDEIAASVATMQSASSLEDVASLVLQREATNTDAEYVHFFHEKIPSRMFAKYTPLAPLDRVISERPAEGAPLRTRAVTKIFKEDYLGAAADLTKALSISTMTGRHDAAILERGGRLSDDDMPSSLEAQLLFHRASTYLAIAMQSVEKAYGSSDSKETSDLEARKAVRTYAKRAIRDYSRFLGGFEYTPGPHMLQEGQLQIGNGEGPSSGVSGESGPASGLESTTELAQATSNLSVNKPEVPSSSNRSNMDRTPLPIYPISMLFSTPAPMLPPPSDQEGLTYHPLITDAMYSTLLCHLLLATPSKELSRYVAMVHRLIRVADGYPVFLAARSPARADWGEVVKKCGLSEWEDENENRGAEYPVCTERAGGLVRWVKEAWGGVVARKKKKAVEGSEKEEEKKEEEKKVEEKKEEDK
ncbi:hypothetical protein BZA77DRAFT_309575 [Pyronema omphalodes]|nr:hypothetical protein BZA77DRAFT_309575 [Pyronema omphalodes]